MKIPVTIQGEDATVAMVLRQLHLETGVSFVVGREFADQTVGFGVREQPVDEVVAAVARAAGAGVNWRTTRLCYVGKLDDTDSAILFRRVRRGASNDVQALAAVVLSREGRLSVTDDGLLVASDVLAAIEKLEQVLTEVEAVGVPVWQVEVYGVQSRDSFERRLSAEIAPVARIGAKIASGVNPEAWGEAAFNAYLEAVAEARDSSLAMHHVVMVPAGSKARIGTQSQRFVTRRTTTADGQTIQNGFDALEAGNILDVGVTEQTDSCSELDLSIDVTTFVDNGDEIPGIEGLRINLPLVVRSGTPYLVGAFADLERATTLATLLRFGRGETSRSSKLSVWVRATRINLADSVAATTLEEPHQNPPYDVEATGQPSELYGSDGFSILSDERP